MSPRISPMDPVRRWAGYTPDRFALAGAGERLTWAELDARVDRTAWWLTQVQDLQRGDRIALLARNHPFFFELLFACLRTGIVLAPLNWRLSPGEISALLALSRPRILIFDPVHAQTAAALDLPDGAPLRPVPMAEILDAPEPTDVLPPWVGAAMEEPACLLFTSGTTGLPKAVVLPVRQLFWNAVNTGLAFKLTRDDATLVYTPLFHTGAINVLAVPLLQCGGGVHVHDGFDPAAVTAGVSAEGVTTLFGVPITLQGLADQPGFLTAARRTLRLCLCGGAPLPLSLIHRYRDAGVLLTQGFGMTEVGPNCFFLPPDQALTRAGSVGRAMPYGEARVRVDGRDAAVDEVGELELAGPHVCAGYLDNPEATDAALVDGWFRTGDLVRMDADGYVHVAGRRKEMFISGGENVYPAEVENALMGHPGIRECAVVPVPDARWGEVGLAFVVGDDLDGEALRPWLRERLAGYKIPKHIALREALPRNPSGKLLRAELIEEARRHVS